MYKERNIHRKRLQNYWKFAKIEKMLEEYNQQKYDKLKF